MANSQQNRIYNTICNLVSLPNVSIEKLEGSNKFIVRHKWVFVPDFGFAWDENAGYYRVYIYLAGSSHDKMQLGYVICTIGNGLTASGFNMLYAFLHKNRANKKSVE